MDPLTLTLPLSLLPQLPGQLSVSAKIEFSTKRSYCFTGDSDFISTPTVVTFSPGQTEATVEIFTLEDTLVEDEEHFHVVLSSFDGSNDVVFGEIITVYIEDTTGMT